jgi:hypothetical protein
VRGARLAAVLDDGQEDAQVAKLELGFQRPLHTIAAAIAAADAWNRRFGASSGVR